MTEAVPDAVASVVVSGVEKRNSPRKHYAYVIRLVWSDDSETTAVRSHKEVFHFQVF